jgi:RND family efflux transporter MFP subunit
MNKTTILIFTFCLTCNAFNLHAKTTEVVVINTANEDSKLVIELSGSVVAIQDAQLSPLQSGVVKDILVDAGDEVVSGQVLISLDDTLAKLRLNQVQATQNSALIQLNEAKRQLQEVEKLAKKQLVQESSLAERKAAVETARAELSNVQSQVALQEEIINRHSLKAPFDGLISQRNVDLGEWISQQSQVLLLVSHKSLRLIAELPQEHINAVKQSEKLTATVIPDAMSDKTLNLPVSNLVLISDPVSRTVEIQIDLPQDSGLIAGASARVQIKPGNTSESLTWIPRTALKRHPDGGHSVFTVTSNKVKRHLVSIVKSEKDKVAVSGLPNQSMIVISGTELLKDDQQVVTKLQSGSL